MSDGHAKAGGQIGRNGEHYKGGQFLPSTTKPKGAARKVKPERKQETAPYTWELAPRPGLTALWGRIRALVDADLKPLDYVAWERFDRAQVEADAAAYAQGFRWYDPEAQTYA